MSAMTPALAALISRVEAEEVGRDLSDSVWLALGWTKTEEASGDWPETWESPTGLWHNEPRPDLTRSLDAQEALPGFVFNAQRKGNIWTAWAAFPPKETDGVTHTQFFAATAPTEAAARLAARLKGMDQS